MLKKKDILKKIVMVYPARFRSYYKKTLDFAGEKHTMAQRLGTSTIIATAFMLLTPLIFAIFLKEYMLWSLPAMIAVFASVIGLDNVLLFFVIEDRKKQIESILPDFLHLISSNIRAGQTPYQALKRSARDEFGPLKEEIDIATTKALGSSSFKEALLSINKRINSRLVGRIFSLFITSMRSGSHMADLLEDTAKDISESQALKNDLATGTKTYTMFILFTVIIGSPLLYSISIHLVDVMSSMNSGGGGGGDDAFGLGLMAGDLGIGTDFIFWMSVFMIVSTAIFSSVLIGVISEGNKKHGLRYAPIIMAVSLGAFMIAKTIVSNMF